MVSISPRSVKGKLHYGWAILALTFTNLSIEGGAKSIQPVLLVAFRDHFQRSAALTSALFSVSGIVGAIAYPFLGRLLDRFGPRVMFPIAGVVLLVGWLASSRASELWQLFIFYSVIATLGQVTLSSFSATATLAPWFPRSKGLVLGLADSGNPAGHAMVVPLAQLIVQTMGWRAAYQIFGVAFFLLAAPLNLLFQRRPPKPEAAETESPAEGEALPAPKIPVGRVLAAPAVWVLLAARGIASTSHQMTTVHIIAFLIFSGYDGFEAALALGVAGLLGIGGRPGFGMLSDVIGREIVFTMSMGMVCLAILLVLVFGDGGSWWVLVGFVGLIGLSDGLSGLLIGAKAADLHPPEVLGAVMGVVEVGRGMGIAVGPVLAGILFDRNQDYTMAFSVAIGLLLAAMALVWAVRFVQRPAVAPSRNAG